MLASYYGKDENTEALFQHLKVSRYQSYREHINQYDVIRVNMQDFLSVTNYIDEMLSILQTRIIGELKRKYPEYTEES